MENLLKQFKIELRKLSTAELKAVAVYKKLASITLELASVKVVTKKSLQNIITETLTKRGLSESSIKKIRGNIMSFFEGSKKYPQKVEMIKKRLENVSSRQEFDKLAKSFKKYGETEPPQKETKSTAKSRAKKEVKIIKGGETIDKSKYYSIISSIVKIDEDTFYKLDDEKIIELFEEVEKIAKILGGIKG